MPSCRAEQRMPREREPQWQRSVRTTCGEEGKGKYDRKGKEERRVKGKREKGDERDKEDKVQGGSSASKDACTPAGASSRTACYSYAAQLPPPSADAGR